MVSSFNYFQMHAWSTSMLLLLHSAFMLSVVNMLLKGEVRGNALSSHGNLNFPEISQVVHYRRLYTFMFIKSTTLRL